MYINHWTKKFLSLAEHISFWSKDPSTKIGAVVIGNNKQILSTGYNGFPRGIQDTSDRLNHRETKYCFTSHAEMNCIFNACLSGVCLDGATLYVYGLPVCAECANGIIQVGIKKVIMQHNSKISDRWAESYQLTKQKFNEARVQAIRYDENFGVIL